MSALSVEVPFPIFTDVNGQPLEDGYIFIGQANQNPITNPISVFFNPGMTSLAAQPIRTIGGYPANAGTPGRLYVNSDYSIQVQNKNGTLVYSSPTATERYNRIVVDVSFTESNAIGDGVQTVFAVASNPLFIYINGVYQNKNTYTVASGNVTFSEAPPLNSVIEFLI